MIITCEKCYAKFNLDENVLKQTGSKVRCSKCQNIFLVYPSTEMEKVPEPAEVPKEEAKAALETGAEEFDLTDLDLEEGMESEPDAEKELEELLELELDTEPVAEETSEESEAGLEIDEQELDLSNIEEMLDIEKEPEAEIKEEYEELELELDTEPAVEETPEEAETDLETEEDKIELSSLNIEEEPETEVKEEPEPEAEIKEEPEAEAEVKEELELEAEAKEEPEPEAEVKEEPEPEAEVETEEASITTEQETTPAEKKRISTPVLIVLIIALLTGGTYATYVALKSMHIKIPFISDLVEPGEPGVQDEVGNLKIIAFDIADKFIDNSKIGKLFIISGKVKNEYSGARSFIKITGKLYAKERVLSKTATVSCGNMLSDQDLSNMDINSINKRLSNLSGDNKSNVNVKPGKLLPFMIVFPNIPDNIEEYTVEVLSLIHI